MIQLVTWEFLNSDGLWVTCIGGEGHAHAAADASGPGKYRMTTTTIQHEEFDV